MNWRILFFMMITAVACKKQTISNSSPIWVHSNPAGEYRPFLARINDRYFVGYRNGTGGDQDAFRFAELKFKSNVNQLKLPQSTNPLWMYSQIFKINNGFSISRTNWSNLQENYIFRLTENLEIIDSIKMPDLTGGPQIKLADGNLLCSYFSNFFSVTDDFSTVIKCNADFQQIWKSKTPKRNRGNGSIGDNAGNLLVTPDNHIWSYGSSFKLPQTSNNEDAFIVIRDENGTILSYHYYEKPNNDAAVSGIVDGNQVVMLCQYTDSNNIGYMRILNLNLDASVKNEANFVLQGSTAGINIFNTTDGYLVFFQNQTLTTQYGLLKLDKQLKQVWVKHFETGSFGNSIQGSCIETHDGNLLIAYDQNSFGGKNNNGDLVFMKVNKNGEIIP